MAGATRGLFVVLEGVDRCGKTTQAKRLVEMVARATGRPCESVRFPDRDTPTGKIIDAYLKRDAQADKLHDRAIHLLFSANRWEAADAMRAKLNAGTSLVCDRYAYSGAVFTAAKGIDLEWCKAPDAGLPEPDLVLFLDLDVDRAKLRGEFGNERYENEAFQKTVRALFHSYKSDPLWQFVDADRTVEQVASDIAARVQSVLDSGKLSRPVGELYSSSLSASRASGASQ